jgi:phosphoribosylformylglycinamidine synthase
MWQFGQAVEGIGEACRALGVPITGGNVSLYNETDGRAIYPTSVIGVVGLLEQAEHVLTRCFEDSGDVIILIGEGTGELGGSEFLKAVYGVVAGQPPALDLARERAIQDLLVELAGAGLLRSAHDCSDGGIAVAIAECCFETAGRGADVAIDALGAPTVSSLSEAAALFGESASRVIVSARPALVTEVLQRAAALGVPARIIGEVGGARLRIAVGGRMAVDLSVADAEQVWASAIEGRFAKQVA